MTKTDAALIERQAFGAWKITNYGHGKKALGNAENFAFLVWQAATAVEREACAALCETVYDEAPEYDGTIRICDSIAAAIRKRGEG